MDEISEMDDIFLGEDIDVYQKPYVVNCLANSISINDVIDNQGKEFILKPLGYTKLSRYKKDEIENSIQYKKAIINKWIVEVTAEELKKILPILKENYVYADDNRYQKRRQFTSQIQNSNIGTLDNPEILPIEGDGSGKTISNYFNTLNNLLRR